MKIMILGGDGFCGWPTALKLCANGHSVKIVDNLSRRRIDKELGSNSLTEIAPISQRIQTARKLVGDISFVNIDIATDPKAFKDLLINFKPDTIVHFAEQRAAPYSMIGEKERNYTVDNNITGTHNLCSAIVEVDRNIHLVHLGTMGVYGYSKAFGAIPEGYLDVNITQTKKDVEILYPANPGSVYHMSKCLDQLIFQFYNKNWGLKITDLHQGIVWGVQTSETKLHKDLSNRFDYDGIYGTVLNRFISQAALKKNLTVYGSGGQSRAFINISDTANCIKIAIENDNFSSERVRIFNQVAEVKSVKQLAKMVAGQYGVSIDFVENPRKELAENELEVSNQGLMSLGFEPILLSKGLVDDVLYLATDLARNFDAKNVLTSPKW